MWLGREGRFGTGGPFSQGEKAQEVTLIAKGGWGSFPEFPSIGVDEAEHSKFSYHKQKDE